MRKARLEWTIEGRLKEKSRKRITRNRRETATANENRVQNQLAERRISTRLGTSCMRDDITSMNMNQTTSNQLKWTGQTSWCVYSVHSVLNSVSILGIRLKQDEGKLTEEWMWQVNITVSWRIIVLEECGDAWRYRDQTNERMINQMHAQSSKGTNDERDACTTTQMNE